MHGVHASQARRSGSRSRSLHSGSQRGLWLPLVLVASLAVSLVLITCLPAQAATERTTLTCTELMSSDPGKVEIVDNAAFLPVGDASPSRHEFLGRLTVPREVAQLGSPGFSSYRFFPGFSVDFFTSGDFIVPANRGIIVNPGNWSLILSPGRVWTEPDDCGMTRASFPFTLGSPPGREYTGGEAHNGVAMLLFGDEGVSSLRIQVTQETAPDGDILDMTAHLPAVYEPGAIEYLDELRAAFAQELEDRAPIRPWSDLEQQYDAADLALLTQGLLPAAISAAGVVVDGTVYLQPSQTRHGAYPYPEYMLHAGMSVSKSIGAGIAMLWLAEEYGGGVFDLRIADYLEITADHDGWADVTFGDVLNMATGVGDNAPEERPFDPYANESGPNYRRFYLAPTAQEKLDAAFAAANYTWGPGELFRYTSAQTFVLAGAMDSFLKSKEGPDADLWERITEEVFRPIGVHHMTMMHVEDEDGAGIPLMASGLRLTVDDLGKVVTLLQNGGVHGDQQLLHATQLNGALHRTGQVAGLPSGKTFADGDQGYHASFWSLAHKTAQGAYFQVPFMSGAGGNTVFLAPNGVSTFVFTDYGQDTYSLNSPAVTEAIRPYPSNGLEAVTLIPRSTLESVLPATIGFLALGGLVLVVVLAFRRRTRMVVSAPPDDKHGAVAVR